MLVLKFGVWQQVMAGESMTIAWNLVKKTDCSLSEGLKQAWQNIKGYFKNISASFKEFRQKIKAKILINNNNTYKNIDNDTWGFIGNILERMKPVRKYNSYNMKKWLSRKFLYKKYNNVWVDTGCYGIVVRKG